ncbi:MAG: fumarylacetoacetate hydrolase family protein, partial [Bacteroidia bacterium]
MKLVTFFFQNKAHLGIYHEEHVYPLQRLDHALPDAMLEFLRMGDLAMNRAKALNKLVLAGEYREMAVPVQNGVLLAPITNPTSCRDGYAFRQHVASARRNRKV